MSSKSIHPEPVALTSPMYFFYHRKHGLVILFSATAFLLFFFPRIADKGSVCVARDMFFGFYDMDCSMVGTGERIATATVNHRRQSHPS